MTPLCFLYRNYFLKETEVFNNKNSAASGLELPDRIPPIIVEPESELPAIKANI